MDKVIRDLVDIDKACSNKVEALNVKKSKYTISLNEQKQEKYNAYLKSFKEESNMNHQKQETEINQQLALQNASFEASKKALKEEFDAHKDEWAQSIFNAIVNE